MTQFQKSIVATVAAAPTERRVTRFGRSGVALIGLVSLAAAIGASALSLGEQQTPAVQEAEALVATDGWLPAVTSASERRRLEAATEHVDGWLPAITSESERRRHEAANQIVDGWAIRYASSDDH